MTDMPTQVDNRTDEIVDDMVQTNELFALGDVEVRGVTYKSFVNPFPNVGTIYSLPALLGNQDETFISYEGECWTFAQAYKEASTLAHALMDDFASKRAIGWPLPCAISQNGFSALWPAP